MDFPLFFDSWNGILRVLIAGVCAYVALVVLLRISGKRSLSKLNAFDLVVTVALGSLLATIVLSKDVPILEGILAFFVLLFLQFVVTWLSVRVRWFQRLVKATPRLLVYEGQLLHGALREERVSVEEIYAILRGSGKTSLDEVGAVVLETDASLHVLGRQDLEQAVMLKTVRGYGDDPGVASEHRPSVRSD